jgi:hypothetical protein
MAPSYGLASGNAGVAETAKILVYTGDGMTYLLPKAAKRRGLELGIPIGSTAADEKLNPLDTNIGALQFPDFNLTLRAKQMPAFKRGNPNMDGLLGREILSLGRFYVNGPKRILMLSLPFAKPDNF